ncbi:Cell division protein FtsQ [Nitrosococcus oceani ATCC 19707]|uniref:Cell division protein FtsQ n=2 Tax=Nitrosococcus oceani TaxID=1229 RepID=Q3J793_NITOC|nr:cell division protein FtsQ/DivIB [Nitrosococcus oceani]ABA59303.1 Cell division protein FtsQ [Nitrosococcus oceani ATCC 19707]KFI18331.1 cell division protein FtsQ [Nitrosococcus oceani C-27]
MARRKKNRRVQRGASRSQPPRAFPWWTIGQGLLTLSLVGVVVWGINHLADPETLPLRQVNIKGQFKYVTQQKLHKVTAGYVKGGFFNVNLKTIRTVVEELPWVAQVNVRRVWPDALQIEVQEKIPLARWGKDALISIEGEIFTPPEASFPQGLPKLQGPPDSERLLVSRLEKIQAQLNSLGLRVVQLTMGERRDWHVVFEDGMELILGRAHSKQRLTRFQQIYAHLLRLHREDIKRVDMRYTNGFAITWHGNTAPAWVREAAFDV